MKAENLLELKLICYRFRSFVVQYQHFECTAFILISSMSPSSRLDNDDSLASPPHHEYKQYTTFGMATVKVAPKVARGINSTN